MPPARSSRRRIQSRAFAGPRRLDGIAPRSQSGRPPSGPPTRRMWGNRRQAQGKGTPPTGSHEAPGTPSDGAWMPLSTTSPSCVNRYMPSSITNRGQVKRWARVAGKKTPQRATFPCQRTCSRGVRGRSRRRSAVPSPPWRAPCSRARSARHRPPEKSRIARSKAEPLTEIGGDRDAVAAARVRARERPAAEAAVVAMPFGPSARLPRSPSSPLAGARRSRAAVVETRSTCTQPRKMSLLACIRRCPSTTRSPWLLNALGLRNSSSTEAWASFICSSSGSPRRHRASARSTRACRRCPRRRLCARSRPAELLEQHPAVVAEAGAKGAQQLVQPSNSSVALAACREVGDRDDQRRIGDDACLAVDRRRELRERRHAVARARLGQRLLGSLDRLGLAAGTRGARARLRCPAARTRPRGCSSPRTRHRLAVSRTVSSTTCSWSLTVKRL